MKYRDVSLSTEDAKKVDENCDDVSVEDDCSEDVIINLNFVSLSSHNELSVEDEVEAENNDSNTANDHVGGPVVSGRESENHDEQSCHT